MPSAIGVSGFNPVSRTHMYMFLLQRSPSNPWIAIEDQPRRLYEAMAGSGFSTNFATARTSPEMLSPGLI